VERHFRSPFLNHQRVDRHFLCLPPDLELKPILEQHPQHRAVLSLGQSALNTLDLCFDIPPCRVDPVGLARDLEGFDVIRLHHQHLEGHARRRKRSSRKSAVRKSIVIDGAGFDRGDIKLLLRRLRLRPYPASQ
jgi:hypothetical protein